MSIIALQVVVFLLNDSWGGNSSHLHVLLPFVSLTSRGDQCGADSKDISLDYRDVIFKNLFSHLPQTVSIHSDSFGLFERISELLADAISFSFFNHFYRMQDILTDMDYFCEPVII